MELTELSEKLGKSAGDLTNRTKELKELLTNCKKFSDDMKEIRVLEQEISKFEVDIKKLKETIAETAKEFELLQSKTKDSNQVMMQVNERVTALTDEYNDALKKYNDLKAALSAFTENPMFKNGLDSEKKKLDDMKQKADEAVGLFHKAHNNYEQNQISCQRRKQELSQLNLALAEKENNLSSLQEKYENKRDSLKDFNISNVDISIIDALVEVAKRVGYYNALADKPAEVKEKEVKQAIDEVVAKKEPETFTKELLYDLFMTAYEGKYVTEDEHKQRTLSLAEADNMGKEFNLVNVLFDDFKTMPDMVASREQLVYVGVKRDDSGYADKHRHPRYSQQGQKSLPTMYRVYNYILRGITEIHKISYRDIIKAMNTLIEEDSLQAHSGSFDANAKDYKYYGKQDIFVPMAVNDDSFIAIPKKYYTYEFLGKLLASYNHSALVICKKGGVIGND